MGYSEQALDGSMASPTKVTGRQRTRIDTEMEITGCVIFSLFTVLKSKVIINEMGLKDGKVKKGGGSKEKVESEMVV